MMGIFVMKTASANTHGEEELKLTLEMDSLKGAAGNLQGLQASATCLSCCIGSSERTHLPTTGDIVTLREESG